MQASRAPFGDPHCSPASGLLARLAKHVSCLVQAVELALQVRRERRMLLGMDDRSLQDIGFDRGRAYGEASRPLWDLPADRLGGC